MTLILIIFCIWGASAVLVGLPLKAPFLTAISRKHFEKRKKS